MDSMRKWFQLLLLTNTQLVLVSRVQQLIEIIIKGGHKKDLKLPAGIICIRMEINSTLTEVLNTEAAMEANKSNPYSNGQTTIQGLLCQKESLLLSIPHNIKI